MNITDDITDDMTYDDIKRSIKGTTIMILLLGACIIIAVPAYCYCKRGKKCININENDTDNNNIDTIRIPIIDGEFSDVI